MVYARHGRELMGCKSPMCEPDRRFCSTGRNISRRQGQLREGLSGGSPSAKLSADEQGGIMGTFYNPYVNNLNFTAITEG
jgi:hypothetical protein